MITLILLTFAVFFILWLGDLYITRKVVKAVGPRAELNPIMKIIVARGRFIWIFKAVEIGAFLYLIYYLTAFGSLPFYILLGYILFYSILVANNSKVYFDITKRESGAFRYIFFALSVVVIIFIYLNYLIYSGLTLSLEVLRKCQTDYKGLYFDCYQKNTTVEVSKELTNILNSINLTIPKP